MKSFKDIASKAMPIEVYSEKKCENCGHIYTLYKTKRGIEGACKPCADKKVFKEFNLPTSEEYRRKKELDFIASFEEVTNDLVTVSVNSYKTNEPSQLDAKQAAVKFIRSFKKNKSQSLVFSGTPGLGKSHLAYAISKAIKEQGYKVLFIKSTHLLQHIRNTYNPHSDLNEEHIFKMVSELDLLVLDDLGAEYIKSNERQESWASDILFKVFDSRLDKATVCTTNYSEPELTAKYGNNGPRIISRMMHQAKGIRLMGEDARRKAAF